MLKSHFYTLEGRSNLLKRPLKAEIEEQIVREKLMHYINNTLRVFGDWSKLLPSQLYRSVPIGRTHNVFFHLNSIIVTTFVKGCCQIKASRANPIKQ